MEELFQFLNSIKPIGPTKYKAKPLSPALKDYLRSVLKEKELKKGELLLRDGEVCRNMWFIQKGLLRCYYCNLNGKEVSRWFMREGDVITSISSFYQQKVGEERIEALEQTFLYFITYDELDTIYNEFPEFERIGRILTNNYFILWDQQLSGILMKSARKRYEWLMDNHPEIVKRVANKHIASWLGITEVTLSFVKPKR